MASNRDRLKAMSKKNSEAAKQMMDVPTLISDMAERKGEEPNNIQASNLKVDNDDTVIQENIVQNNSEAPKDVQNELGEEKSESSEKIESDVPEAFIPETNQNNETESINDNTNTQNQDEAVNTDNLEIPIPDSENNSEDIPVPASTPEVNLADKYQGPEIIISLLLQEESNNYLTYKAMDLRISSKQLLKDLLIKELEQGYKEDELCPIYRRTQHQTTKRSMVIDKQLKEDIQEAAIKYRMRYTAFISYVVYKAYINDSEYKELM